MCLIFCPGTAMIISSTDGGDLELGIQSDRGDLVQPELLFGRESYFRWENTLVSDRG